jgi:hypothetical protein
MPDRKQYPKCFGPYLRYAISTEFDYFKFVDEDKDFKLFLLIEFKTTGRGREFSRQRATEFVDGINSFLPGIRPSESAYLSPADDNAPYGTLIAPIAAVTTTEDRQGSLSHLWDRFASRVELSMPLKRWELPRGAKPELDDERKRLPAKKKKSPAKKLLIGILDDGCPFAAAQFLKASASGDPTTRVRAIWDQNVGRNPIPVGTRHFGQAYYFGLEFRRESSAGQIGLDEWMKLHVTKSGANDEDNCYADAGFTRLAPQQSHGAHVMDRLAGGMPPSSRLGPVGTGPGGTVKERRDPPSWNPATDPVCNADVDVVFVQYSDDCIKDATGVWLPAYVPAGIRYIMSFADPNVIDRVIINLSWGPTTGPHDGTALLEAALNALVAQYNGTPGYPQLDIFLAAGNSFPTEEHVTFTADAQHPDVEWSWRLPPDNSVLCFAEIWMDSAQTPSVTLTSPSGVAVPVASPVTLGDTMYRLEVGPTVAAPGVVAAEHGDYTVRVSGLGAGAEIHSYAARTDPNLGVIIGAKRSYFVDAGWEKTRSASASCTFENGEFDKRGSLISRLGTLNGTANVGSVHVAGGFVVLSGRKSLYSSAGPARGNPATRRSGPDYVLPCDESNVLCGVLAGGTRSGVVFRLIGTSTAAPQFARLFAKGPLPAPIPYPLPSEPERRGLGDLEPP